MAGHGRNFYEAITRRHGGVSASLRGVSRPAGQNREKTRQRAIGTPPGARLNIAFLLQSRMEETCCIPSRCTKTRGFAATNFVGSTATEAYECPTATPRELRTSERRVGTIGASCESTAITHKPIGPATTRASRKH